MIAVLICPLIVRRKELTQKKMLTTDAVCWRVTSKERWEKKGNWKAA